MRGESDANDPTYGNSPPPLRGNMRGLNVQLHTIFAASCGAMLALAASALNLGYGLHAMTFAVIAGALYIPVWALEVEAEAEPLRNDIEPTEDR